MEMTPEFYQAFSGGEIRKRSNITEGEAEFIYQFGKLPAVQRILEAAIRTERMKKTEMASSDPRKEDD